MDEPKKISFGFSKINKKAPPLVQPKKIEPQVQFIDCLEGQNIKLINGEEEKEKPKVIPMGTASVIRDRILEAINAREEMKKSGNGEANKESDVGRVLTLEEQAAKEILDDLKKDKESDEVATKEVPMPTEEVLGGKKESSLEDYENMPIEEFGLAMLRGMGWDPTKGIGLNGKIVEPTAPAVRPKGMGLGADKMLLAKAQMTAGGDELVMKKGAAVQVIAGPFINCYGKIEGFDELPGRIIVRLLADKLISTSEFMVKLVSTGELNRVAQVTDKYVHNQQFVDSKTVSSARPDSIAKGEDDDRKPAKREYKSHKEAPPSESRRTHRKRSHRESSDDDSGSSRKRSRDRDHHRRRKHKKDKKSRKHKKSRS